MDRSIGALRKKLRELDIEKNTLLVCCSDNVGLPEIKPDPPPINWYEAPETEEVKNGETAR